MSAPLDGDGRAKLHLVLDVGDGGDGAERHQVEGEERREPVAI